MAYWVGLSVLNPSYCNTAVLDTCGSNSCSSAFTCWVREIDWMLPVSPCPRSPDVHYDSAAKVGPRPDLASQKDDLNFDLGQIADTFRGVQVVLPPGGVPGNIIQLTQRLESAYTDSQASGVPRQKGPAGTTQWRWIMAVETHSRRGSRHSDRPDRIELYSDFVVDWTWFGAIGYLDVFWTVFSTRALLFLTVFAATTIILWANGWLASRLAKPGIGRFLELAGATVRPPLSANVPDVVRRRLPLFVAGAAAFLGGLLAAAEMTNWDVLLKFIYQVPYGQRDPIFGNDIGFYLFSLPAYIALKNWMLLTVSLSVLSAGTVYWVRGHIELDGQRRRISRTAIAHGSALLGVFFAVKAWSYGLDRYLLLYGDNGVVVGASYTDVHVELPVLWLLIGLAVIAAIVSWANLWVRTYKLPLAATALVFGSAFVLAEVFPVLFERLFVKPNELELERPYIQQNITLTRQAYNLHQMATRAFPVEQSLTSASLQANQATIDNIRLWDEQPLMATYRQLQEIRTYYKFGDVDVDRYWLDGAYRQVMLSARELASTLLPSNAQTWVNRHVLFTHGNGVIMSPVTRKSAEGLPVFYLSDIPPVATGGPPVREPRIYYGELTDTYVLVKGSTPEFDYPKGKDNVYAPYGGVGGVPVGSAARRALFAWYFNDPNILISSYVTAESRIMFRRTIKERVETIAPFLHLDHNPYLVVSEGRLFWVQDAYTTSDYFPYAVPYDEAGGLNYIRNSVKVVVDAYNGSVDLYLADPSDPIATTYQRIFPGLFEAYAAMPPDLQRHMRYPEDLFLIQAHTYGAYHMEAPEVFYNREDLWQFPRQPAARAALP